MDELPFKIVKMHGAARRQDGKTFTAKKNFVWTCNKKHDRACSQ